MSGSQLVAILTTSLSLALLLIVVFRLWPSARLDQFRQEMFALRDELFDYAADGHISFNDPAYRLLRQSMNGFIRYAHNLTFFRVSLMMIYWHSWSQKPQTKWWDSWNRSMEQLKNDSVREELRKFHTRSLDLVAIRLVTGSPVLISCLMAVSVTLVVEQRWRSLRQSYEDVMNRFIDPKILEEEAANA